MNQEYYNTIPTQDEMTIELEDNEQKTPQRITIEYQTTGKFKDISQESDES